MLLFYSLVAVMLLIALGFPVWSLLRRNTSGRAEDNVATAVGIHKLRLEELENELRLGTITSEQVDSARQELERALLNEAGEKRSTAVSNSVIPARSTNWVHIGVFAILIPAVALSVYFYLGAPSLIPVLGTLEDESHANDAAHGDSAASLESIVASLAKRLEKNPDDQEGLFLLGRSYMAVERFSDAADTYQKLLAITGDRPDVLLAYADSVAMANQGQFTALGEDLVQRALKLEPENITGLWLAGLAAFKQERYETALEYWRTLQPKLTPASDDAKEIERLIAAANTALGRAELPSEATAATAVATPEDTGNGPALTVMVEMSPEIAAQAKPEQLVFIYARAVNGPPMPLAVAQRRVADLPVEVILDDSQAMTPEAKLSGFAEVAVGARISSTGDAVARSGDFEAEAAQVQTTTSEPVKLRISNRRQ